MADDRWLSERAWAAEAAVSDGFDLSQCVREPIHLLGGIQSYGSLLAVDPAAGRVEVAAENTGTFFGVPAEALVGEPVTRVLSADYYAEALAGTAGDEEVPVAFPVVAGHGWATGGPVDVSAHRRDGLLVLEFEPRSADAPAFSAFYQGVRRALARLRAATTVEDCCAVAAREVRALTGFDRVVVYRFDGDDGPGEVIAEEVTDGWEPWLGLWFPATDIPPQARRLYRENWIRVISDVDDATVGLRPGVRPSTGAPLDLSQAALRTVSGFHLEYLRNIGVRSSMSVSVLREGRLWGLVACHGAGPVRPAPEVRSACEMFGTAFSLHLAVIEERERADALAESGRRAASVARLLEEGLEDRFTEHAGAVADLLRADGVLLRRDGRTAGGGDAFPEDLVRALGRRAAGLTPGEVWATDRLAELPAGEPADDLTDASAGGTAGDPEGEPSDGPAGDPQPWPAGVLMVPVSRRGDFLAWSRRERPAPRQWAADPATPLRVGPRGERLTPRGSSAVFRATMRGRSLPWSARDEAAARELWRLLTELVLRHADAVTRLNEELRTTNEDLASFAHAAAHDLKEPLRGISNAATFALEDATGLDAVTLRRLRTTRRLADHMDALLNSLLHYSRLGRAGLRVTETDLGAALDAAVEVAGPRLAEQRVTLRRGALPRLRADPDRLHEVLVNLLVNAAKYARDGVDRWVEVSARRGPAGETVVVVRDNGIGIPAEQQDEVFGLFRRLHAASERGGGTGVGLAVVKRIVERHGGRMWLESEPGVGTAFFFTLGAPPASG
ncbi:ATP-binding protein [Streptomyces griseoviridis]|uniref:Sensor-like histidine kinase SenX3 n=1 Tax=Streptomyces griseoviridis TaxID=45398 RepID=A0ABT9LHP8_STRGD|nr:ATP-binding protein [Streptomyces griseoviridis]MDP9681996.1 light-regulated signal transduction histidine kinase (bacteriophytochrome) [Streptomyces griseoviridis]GGT03258.1 histidine kinase [Streptomyces griseoviridis]